MTILALKAATNCRRYARDRLNATLPSTIAAETGQGPD